MPTRLILAVALTLAACARDGDRTDVVQEDTASPHTMPMQSGMMMDSGGMSMSHMMMDSVMMMDSAGGMRGDRQMAAASDADHMFLRMMSDHHEGLVRMSMAAMNKGSTDAVKAAAHRLHVKQAAERDTMVAALKRDYREEHQVMPTRRNALQADSLSKAAGTAYDELYYRMVIEHHRQGNMMIDHMLPRMQKPAVRRMAEKMRSDQQREIEEFERKLRRG